MHSSSGNDLTPSLNDSESLTLTQQVRTPAWTLINAFIKFPKILICLVNGPCIGIAATTAALADIIYCHEKAYFYTPFTALGLCAEGCSSFTFPQILGQSKACELLILNHKMSAQEAYQFGFVANVYKNESEIWEKLKEIDDLPLGSIVANKRLIRGQMIKKLDEVNNQELVELEKRFETEEAMEAMVRFQMRKKSKL